MKPEQKAKLRNIVSRLRSKTKEIRAIASSSDSYLSQALCGVVADMMGGLADEISEIIDEG